MPYKGWGQPYCAWIGLTLMTLTVATYGYTTFLPGGWWSISTFFSYYTMCFVCPILWLFWKLLKRTKVIPAHETDLVWERPVIDAYEATFTEEPMGFWEEMGTKLGLKKKTAHIE